MLERIQQTLKCGIGRSAPVGVPAHDIDDDHQCGIVIGRDGDAILIVFPVSNET
jgi:hypothetical protein